MSAVRSNWGLFFSCLMLDFLLHRDVSARLMQSERLLETRSMPSSSLELSTRGRGFAIRSFKYFFIVMGEILLTTVTVLS